MSADFHIKLDGVDGEATHKDHKGEIDILSWQWGLGQASAADAGGGSGKGKATAEPFMFVHLYDKASPVLAKQCASGKHFPTMKLTARKAGEGQKDYLTITLKEVFITRLAIGASGGGDLSETVYCTFKDIEFAYKPQDDKGGLGGEVKFGWNLGTTETR
ncbi:MAG: type VI secretion system tube protein Hcp [Variovorax sp.]|nr:MAG: type VI secretion system tube protein Hcp [Variovorax sp.]